MHKVTLKSDSHRLVLALEIGYAHTVAASLLWRRPEVNAVWNPISPSSKYVYAVYPFWSICGQGGDLLVYNPPKKQQRTSPERELVHLSKKKQICFVQF
jgi:hypothetical protein